MKTGESNIQESYRLQSGADEFYLGMDVGSVSVKLVVMAPAREVLKEEYRRHLGQPQGLALELLSSLEPEFPLCNCRLTAFTGLGGQVLAEVLGGTLVNEVIAQARGTYHFHPEARTIIDMGGEDAGLKELITKIEEIGPWNPESQFWRNSALTCGRHCF